MDLKLKVYTLIGEKIKRYSLKRKTTSDIVDRKTKNTLLCCMNLVLNIWDI